MIKERIYSDTNKCMNRIKTSSLDQMLKVRLECHFIRLKRHILSYPANVALEDIVLLEELSEEVLRSNEKDDAVSNLEAKIKMIINSGSCPTNQGPHDQDKIR